VANLFGVVWSGAVGLKACSGVELVRQEAWRLLEAHEITGWEALYLCVCPPARALEADRAKRWAPEVGAGVCAAACGRGVVVSGGCAAVGCADGDGEVVVVAGGA
jgi:hypothetical protein